MQTLCSRWKVFVWQPLHLKLYCPIQKPLIVCDYFNIIKNPTHIIPLSHISRDRWWRVPSGYCIGWWRYRTFSSSQKILFGYSALKKKLFVPMTEEKMVKLDLWDIVWCVQNYTFQTSWASQRLKWHRERTRGNVIPAGDTVSPELTNVQEAWVPLWGIEGCRRGGLRAGHLAETPTAGIVMVLPGRGDGGAWHLRAHGGRDSTMIITSLLPTLRNRVRLWGMRAWDVCVTISCFSHQGQDVRNSRRGLVVT